MSATVLIVNDESQLLEIAAAEAEDTGFEVITAASPQRALEVLEGSTKVDVLFTDIRMPRPIDGWELANRARQLRQNLPVLYATGYCKGIPSDLRKGTLFSKPYNIRSVISALREAVA